MKCPKCNSKMWLRFSSKGPTAGTFLWSCSEYPICKATKAYEPPADRFDFAGDDFTPILNSLDSLPASKKEEVETEIRVQMVNILKHFISCTWGAHYNTLFERIIKPYLQNPYVLDYVLKSNSVRDEWLVGVTGAKIFPALATYLRRVDSEKIQQYLDTEFSGKL